MENDDVQPKDNNLTTSKDTNNYNCSIKTSRKYYRYALCQHINDVKYKRTLPESSFIQKITTSVY